jgi:uncharacterized iron-regulated membrane protein
MASFNWRGVWRPVHRWTAIALMVLLVPISLSGSLLVWREPLDALLHPARYATTGPEMALPAAAYLANAQAAVGRELQVTALQFPHAAGRPVTVTARSRTGARRLVTVYLDPPTARVIDVVDFRASFLGFVHRFHENLTVPEFSGRAVVGWAGTGMLALSLTGLWMWWPRGRLTSGLRWRRSSMTSANLHHLVGFWISLPLAVISATGIYIAFPQTARSLTSSVMATSPQGVRRGAGEVVRDLAMTPDRALAVARAEAPDMVPTAIFLPARAAGRSADQAGPAWRVDLLDARGATAVTIIVDDRAATAHRLAEPPAGDRAAQWIRWVHEGSHTGPAWRLAVFFCGLCPTLLAITGLIVWWRGRAARRVDKRPPQVLQVGAAE